MSNTIKKLDLVRETVRTMRTRTGMRTGLMPVTHVPDGPINDSDSASGGSSGGSSSVVVSASSVTKQNTSTMTSAMEISASNQFSH